VQAGLLSIYAESFVCRLTGVNTPMIVYLVSEVRMTRAALQTIYVTIGPTYQVCEQCLYTQDKKSIDCVLVTVVRQSHPL